MTENSERLPNLTSYFKCWEFLGLQLYKNDSGLLFHLDGEKILEKSPDFTAFCSLTTVMNSWTWSAAGTSCESVQGCKRQTRCRGGSNCFVYPRLSSLLAPSAHSHHFWEKQRGIHQNLFLPETMLKCKIQLLRTNGEMCKM